MGEQAAHTPEPWQERAGHIYSEGRRANICSVSAPRASNKIGYSELEIWSEGFAEACANARRIVAAVNACAGLSTEDLEGGAVANIRKALEGIISAYDSEDHPVPSGLLQRHIDHARAFLRLTTGGTQERPPE